MDLLLTLGLPLSLAVIMASLGLGLTLADFARVLRAPRAFVVGLLAQMALLPLVAFALLQLVALPPELAFGVMILAVCPGGVTTNMLTRLAGGDVALSVSLTGVVSLASVATVPLLVGWSSAHFLGAAAGAVNVGGIALSMAAITAVPVMLGMLVRHLAPGFTARIEPTAFRLATALFAVVIVVALAANWTLFRESIATLGPLLVAMNLVLLGAGFWLARVAGLGRAEARAISIEAGVQNGTLGITVAGLIAVGGGLGAAAIPSAVYGITMYLVTLPIVWVFRRASMAALRVGTPPGRGS